MSTTVWFIMFIVFPLLVGAGEYLWGDPKKYE